MPSEQFVQAKLFLPQFWCSSPFKYETIFNNIEMGKYIKEYQVKPNTVGFLYRDNNFEEKLTPGYYDIKDKEDRTELFCLPETSRLVNIPNQEVLSKDNVALRFSFTYVYRIVDGQKFLSRFALDKQVSSLLQEAEQRISNIVQVFIRNRISDLDCESINEKRNDLTDFKTDTMENQVAEFGILIEQAQLKDLTFPKSIQDLFAKHLEAKIRAKAELENARTVVATARALKNASEIMKDDDNIKFFKLIEALVKIADKGKNTFMISDLAQLIKK